MSKKKKKKTSKAKSAKKTVKKKVEKVEAVTELGFWDKWKSAFIWTGGGVLAVVILVGSYTGFYFYSQGRVPINVRLSGERIGLLTDVQLRSQMEEVLEKYAEKTVRLRLRDQEVDTNLKDLGVSIDLDKSVGGVELVGERMSHWDFVKHFFIGLDYNVKFSVDEEVLVDSLEDYFELKDKRASNAKVVLNEDGGLDVLDESSGERLMYDEFVAGLKSDVKSLDLISRSLPMVNEDPQISADEVRGQIDLVRSHLDRKLTVVAGGERWTVNLFDKLDWVSFVRKDASRLVSSAEAIVELPFDLELEEELVFDFLEGEVAAKVRKPAESVLISLGDNGEVVFDGRPVSGARIDFDKAVDLIEEAVNSGGSEVEIPVEEVAPEVVVNDESLEEKGIRELIATGYTTFYGSPSNRIHNIAVGIERYDGLMIAPGESFSFNSHLGPVDARAGYRPELVIKGDETIPEYGGGLCQVSTTFYRAALYAGLPIEQRSPHSYAVGYYAQVGGHGLDATIYPDVGKDVVIKNDTPGHILIQSYSQDGQAFFHFYGSDDNRSVRMEGPYISNRRGPGPARIEETTTLAPGIRKQVESSHGGFDATWFRYVEKDGKEEKETIFSGYRAVPAKYLVGAGETVEEEN